MDSCFKTLSPAALLALLAAGCGAKTGLLLPDSDVEDDADHECRPEPVEIDRRRAEVLFVIDRSASMDWALEGGLSGPSRWGLLRDALSEVLPPLEHLLEYGAELFPLDVPPWVEPTPENTCSTAPGIDLRPAPHNAGRLLSFFETTFPRGGTPTAEALLDARGYLLERPRPEIARFVVLATDGGPNCNDTVPPEDCLCTGPWEYCDELPQEIGNCLDDSPIEIMGEMYENLGVPIFVIGIDDPFRPDLADVLDQMAVAGGRPRDVAGERRFYSIRREGDLFDALTAITDAIARCVFLVEPSLAAEPTLEVLLDGEPLRRDPSDGWSWTDPAGGELTLFGSACERAVAPDATVEARVACP